MLTATRRSAKTVAQATLVVAGLLVGAAPLISSATAAQPKSPPGLTVVQILNGKNLHHTFVAGGKSHSEALTGPDDLTRLGDHLYTAFQNGVGAQGEPSADGNTDSTVVEFTASGHVVRQWDLKGKCDGLTADPHAHVLIATVNEDAKSSVYTIAPGAPAANQITHFHYNRPLPHNGGTDAISIFHGLVIVSASAPGTTGQPAPQPTYPALYIVTFHPARHVATITSLLSDEATAVVANRGQAKVVKLALTDPDSNAVVPHSAPRFGGTFELNSQGDLEQIFIGMDRRSGTPRVPAVLRLSQSIDDSAWVLNRSGRLYATDSTADTVDVVTGRFPEHAEFVAVTPCNANSAPATCPAPGFPPNYLGVVNMFTGHVSKVTVSGPTFNPKGMLFVG